MAEEGEGKDREKRSKIEGSVLGQLLRVNRLQTMRFSLCIFLFLVGAPALWSATPLKVDVSAKGAILINADTGAILYAKNAEQPLFPASTTKVATALYALEKMVGRLDEPILASPNAVGTVSPQIRRAAGAKHPSYRLEYGGTHMGIKNGEVLTFRQLLHGLMLASANDAANVLAEHISGSIPRFVEELGDFVKQKGCHNTHLTNPHGLHDPEHQISAADMAVLAREAMQHPLFREIVKLPRFTRLETNKQPEVVLGQSNMLLRPGNPFYYRRAIGIKTGYTDAGRCALVAAAKDGNRNLISVLLGCPHNADRYSDAIALFEAAFNERKVSRTLFSKGFDTFTTTVRGGNRRVEAALADDLQMEYYPSEEAQFHTQISWLPLALPVAAGRCVGELQVISEQGELLISAPVFALSSVEKTFSFKVQLCWLALKGFIWRYMTIFLALTGIATLWATYAYFHLPSASRRRRKRVKN